MRISLIVLATITTIATARILKDRCLSHLLPAAIPSVVNVRIVAGLVDEDEVQTEEFYASKKEAAAPPINITLAFGCFLIVNIVLIAVGRSVGPAAVHLAATGATFHFRAVLTADIALSSKLFLFKCSP